MSDFVHNQGYIYPITNEEYKKLDEKYIDIEAKGYDLEVFDGQKGLNRYLVFLTYHSYGKKHDNFGSSRPCNQQEIYYYASKFREILGEIDTAKLKYIEYCWYNCSECFDYYEEDKPMTLNEAITHAKEIAASKCDECGKEHQKLAEWLTELQGYKDETPITKKLLIDNGFYENGQRLYKTNGKPFFYGIEVHHVENEIHKSYHFYFSRQYYPMYEATFKTIGQLRMFLTLCGFGDFAKQLKA